MVIRQPPPKRLNKWELGLVRDSDSQTQALECSALRGAGLLELTQADVEDWCRQNQMLLMSTVSMEMDMRRKIASRTQFMTLAKSVADQFVTANFTNTPLEFCRCVVAHFPARLHARQFQCVLPVADND